MCDRQLLRRGRPAGSAAVLAGMLLLGSPGSAASRERGSKRITLRDALALARKNNRMLRVARARIGEARGNLTQASVLLVSNPELGIAVGPRFMTASQGRVTVELDAHLEQSLQLGGQRRHRRSLARAKLHASQASVTDTRRVIDLAVSLLVYRVLAARERVQLLRENVALAAALLETTRMRVTQGADTQLDLNAGRLRVAEARRQVRAAETARDALRVRLATVCGLPPGTRLRLAGSLPVPKRVPGRDTLTRKALRERPDLTSVRHRIEAAKAAVRLARSSSWPDLTLGVAYAREEGSNVVLFTLKVSLPFFNRRQGRKAHALARLRGIQAERSGAERSVAADVLLAWEAHRQASQALQLYSGDVLSAQRASLRLLQRSLREGKVGPVKVLLVQRELLAGREGYLLARLAYAESLARLRAAACLPQATPDSEGGH